MGIFHLRKVYKMYDYFYLENKNRCQEKLGKLMILTILHFERQICFYFLHPTKTIVFLQCIYSIGLTKY